MTLLYFIEGTKAAEWGREKSVSPVKKALGYYIPYWKVCAPLVLIGGLFFCEISESPIYCPMFRNLGFLNVSRAILALSNNIHEGTWLISSIAIMSGPFRFIGRKWTTYWMAQFYVAMYYYHVAASVYAGTGSAFASYLIFLLMTGLLLYALDWGYRRLETALRCSWLSVPAMLLTLAVPFLLRLALEVSMDSYAQFAYLAAQQWPIRAMVNVLAIFCLILILRALMGSWLPAGLTVTVLMTLLAIANHYTMKYHGALLTVEDIHNVGTVTGVISGYDLSVDAIAGRILLLEAAAAACCILAWLCARPLRDLYTRRQRWVNRLACLLAAVVSLYFSYFSAVPIIERQDNIWSWGSLYAKIGYLSGTVESTLANLEFSVYKPDGYSDERMAQIAGSGAERKAGGDSRGRATTPIRTS